MQERIYLDNTTATKPSKTAVQAMMSFYEEAFGSPCQPHEMGQELLSYLEGAYGAIYSLFNAKADDTFVFTSSGAEAVSQAIASVYKDVVRKKGKNHFVVSALQEAPALYEIMKLEEEGAALTLAKAHSGLVTVEAVEEAITPRTCLISLPWGSGLTGVIQPLSEIVELCKLRSIFLHIDATHVVGKLHVELSEMGANYITFDGNGILAPRGTGGLFVQNAPIHTLISGGKEDIYHHGAPLDVPKLIALGQAAIEAKQNENLYGTEVCRLRNKLEEGILNLYPEAKVLFQDQERLPHISAISFYGVRNEALLFALNEKKLYASMGGGNLQSIELMLQACQVDKTESQCSLSFSLSKDTTESAIDRAVELITDTAKRLRRLSKTLL